MKKNNGDHSNLSEERRPPLSQDGILPAEKKGHFAKQCPQGKPAKLMTYIQDEIRLSFSDNDLESLLSAADELGPETICAIEGLKESEKCY